MFMKSMFFFFHVWCRWQCASWWYVMLFLSQPITSMYELKNFYKNTIKLFSFLVFLCVNFNFLILFLSKSYAQRISKVFLSILDSEMNDSLPWVFSFHLPPVSSLWVFSSPSMECALVTSKTTRESSFERVRKSNWIADAFLSPLPHIFFLYIAFQSLQFVPSSDVNIKFFTEFPTLNPLYFMYYATKISSMQGKVEVIFGFARELQIKFNFNFDLKQDFLFSLFPPHTWKCSIRWTLISDEWKCEIVTLTFFLRFHFENVPDCLPPDVSHPATHNDVPHWL